MVDRTLRRINLFTWVFGLLFVAQLMDVVYTREVVLHHGMEEANPFAAMLIVGGGWLALLFVKAFPCMMGMLASLFMVRTEWWVKALVWFGVAVYMPLVGYHLMLAYNNWTIL